MDDDLEQARYILSQAAAGTYVMRHEAGPTCVLTVT